jgi:hypothetical protein
VIPMTSISGILNSRSALAKAGVFLWAVRNVLLEIDADRLCLAQASSIVNSIRRHVSMSS